LIILTNPIQVKSSLGGSATVGYDKMVVFNITADPVSNIINAQVKLVVSTDSTQPPLLGSLVINPGQSICILTIDRVDFFRTFNIASSVSVVSGWVTSLQNNIETGLVSIAAVTGTQSGGI
jgi:hypothetical protein